MTSTRIERIVVTGGRNFADFPRIADDLLALRPLGLRRVAHGNHGINQGGSAAWWRNRLESGGWHVPTKSADALAHLAAVRLGLDEIGQHPADWTVDGNAAGPRRNIRMLEAERPDLVLAYPDPDSRGTWHCVKQAIHRGIPVACWMGFEYALLGDAIWRRHPDRPNVQVMTFGRADVVDFDCVVRENSRLIVVPSKGRGNDEALDLGRAIRDALGLT